MRRATTKDLAKLKALLEARRAGQLTAYGEDLALEFALSELQETIKNT